MNNYEKIKSMSIEELAELFATMKPKGCGLCMGVYHGCLRQVSCKGSILEWLMSNKTPRKLEAEE